MRAFWRTWLVLVALAVACLSAAALADPTPGAGLRIGTSADYKPFTFRDTPDHLSGFDIDVAHRLAADLGRPPELVIFRWPELTADLRGGVFDIAMSGVTVRADRAAVFAFTRPYATTGAVAVVREAERERFHTTADLDRPAVRVAVNRGGHLEDVARHHFPHAQLMPVADNLALPDWLARGAAEAVISDQIEVDTWPAGHFAVIGPFTHDRKAYALPRAATDLLHRVDEWLAAREADGWLNEERRRWFGAQATVTAEQASLEALVMAVDLRLQLMPLVAAIKRRDHLPIQDPAQEARVLERARGSATAADLDPNDVAALFQVLIDAAKVVERQAADAPVPEGMQLEDVRAAVATCSDQLIRELARGQPWLRGSDTHDRLDATIRTGLTVPGLTPALVARLVDALGSVRQATSGGALK